MLCPKFDCSVFGYLSYFLGCVSILKLQYVVRLGPAVTKKKSTNNAWLCASDTFHFIQTGEFSGCRTLGIQERLQIVQRGITFQCDLMEFRGVLQDCIVCEYVQGGLGVSTAHQSSL